jgi:uncharacterized protein (TIGR03790 family)
MIRNSGYWKYIKKCIFFVLAAVFFFFSAPCDALQPHEILVIANKNAARSVGLAQYYMQKRNIPQANLVELWITDKEWCSRKNYEERAVYKIRKHLKEKDPNHQIRCLVTMYGVPLKVMPPTMTTDEKKQVEDLRKKRTVLNDRIKALDDLQKEQAKRLRKELKTAEKRIAVLTRHDHRASFDSELALVLRGDYSLSGWVLNPFFIGFKNKKLSRDKILIVSRLDGPSDKIVKRIIDDSIETERTGLGGSAYFDARWKRPVKDRDPKAKIDYGFYDRSIYAAAELVDKSKIMTVVVNDKPELFKPGECPDAALYCGWYSLAKYVDAFTWQKGAVGYHIASAECSTLKRKDSQVWCKKMLESGVAATLGPTSEPYLQAFPVPEIFFGLLLDGQLSLAECYALSKPFWSWQMVLIGDPLYRPFRSGKGGK